MGNPTMSSSRESQGSKPPNTPAHRSKELKSFSSSCKTNVWTRSPDCAVENVDSSSADAVNEVANSKDRQIRPLPRGMDVSPVAKDEAHEPFPKRARTHSPKIYGAEKHPQDSTGSGSLSKFAWEFKHDRKIPVIEDHQSMVIWLLHCKPRNCSVPSFDGMKRKEDYADVVQAVGYSEESERSICGLVDTVHDLNGKILDRIAEADQLKAEIAKLKEQLAEAGTVAANFSSALGKEKKKMGVARDRAVSNAVRAVREEFAAKDKARRSLAKERSERWTHFVTSLEAIDRTIHFVFIIFSLFNKMNN